MVTAAILPTSLPILWRVLRESTAGLLVLVCHSQGTTTLHLDVDKMTPEWLESQHTTIVSGPALDDESMYCLLCDVRNDLRGWRTAYNTDRMPGVELEPAAARMGAA